MFCKSRCIKQKKYVFSCKIDKFFAQTNAIALIIRWVQVQLEWWVQVDKQIWAYFATLTKNATHLPLTLLQPISFFFSSPLGQIALVHQPISFLFFSSACPTCLRTSPIGSLKPILENKHTKNSLQHLLLKQNFSKLFLKLLQSFC